MKNYKVIYYESGIIKKKEVSASKFETDNNSRTRMSVVFYDNSNSPNPATFAFSDVSSVEEVKS